MVRVPPSRFHANEIELHVTSDGNSAMLTLVNEIQGFAVTMSRPALERLYARMSHALERPAGKGERKPPTH